MSFISGEMMHGASQHGVTANQVSEGGPARSMMVVGLAAIGALAFGGLGAAFATQGVPYLIGFGAVLGLMLGAGAEFVRRPLGPEMTAGELSTAGPARLLLVVALSLTGALAFAGLGLAFASQGIAYLAGFGAALGLLFGIGMEAVYLGGPQNAAAGPWRLHLMVAPAFIGALAFGGLGAALATQGIPYLIGFGAVLGLMCGVGVEVVRRPFAPRSVPQVARHVAEMTATVPASAGVLTGMFMDGTQTAKNPLIPSEMSSASTAAGSSFATNMSASMLSNSR